MKPMDSLFAAISQDWEIKGGGILFFRMKNTGKRDTLLKENFSVSTPAEKV